MYLKLGFSPSRRSQCPGWGLVPSGVFSYVLLQGGSVEDVPQIPYLAPQRGRPVSVNIYSLF